MKILPRIITAFSLIILSGCTFMSDGARYTKLHGGYSIGDEFTTLVELVVTDDFIHIDLFQNDSDKLTFVHPGENSAMHFFTDRAPVPVHSVALIPKGARLRIIAFRVSKLSTLPLISRVTDISPIAEVLDGPNRGVKASLYLISDSSVSKDNIYIKSPARKYLKKEPNQSLQTTTMAVTDAAAQPPRQP